MVAVAGLRADVVAAAGERAGLLVQLGSGLFVQEQIRRPAALGGFDELAALLRGRPLDSLALLAVEGRPVAVGVVLVAGVLADAAGVDVHARHAPGQGVVGLVPSIGFIARTIGSQAGFRAAAQPVHSSASAVAGAVISPAQPSVGAGAWRPLPPP